MSRRVFAIPLLFCITLTLPVAPAIAQSTQMTELEDIVVTARRREERLQDVPISMAIVGGQTVQDLQIYDLEDLSALVPNLFIFESTGGDQIRIRGIASSTESPEKSVGLLVDDIFLGAGRFNRMGFLDVNRVEVLRGPQGALIGKNTSAGAISVVSEQPTDELDAWGRLTYEFDGDEGAAFEGAVSGPIVDTLSARVALNYSDRDGWHDNFALDEMQPAVEEWMARGILRWQPTDRFDIRLHYTYFDSDEEGGDKQKWLCDAQATAFFLSQGQPAECDRDYRINEVVPVNGEGNFHFYNQESSILGLNIDWTIGDLTLTSITGFADLESFTRDGADRSPLELANTRLKEDYEQWSQEFRLASPTGERFEYLVGAYFLHKEDDGQTVLDINFPAVGGPLPFGIAPVTLSEGESDNWAVFGQLTWNINDQWSATVDGRYTDEEQEASQITYTAPIYELGPPLMLPPFPVTVTPTRERSADDFSPGLAVQWRPGDELNVYGSVRSGFKSGGFNFTDDAPPGKEEFDDEEVLAYELGFKGTLAGGSLQLNAALFRMEFDDLQVSIVDNSGGVPAAFIDNAAEATSQGIELDATWIATDNLRLFGSVAYLDAEYDDFPGAECYFMQTIAEGCDPGPSGDINNIDDNTQNLGGKPLVQAPEWQAVLNGEYVWPITPGLELVGFLQARFSDEYFINDDLDPVLKQDSYWKLDARVTLRDARDGMWEVAFVGKNLNDELTMANGNDLPGIVPGHAYSIFVERPRSLSLQGRVNF